LRLLGGSDTTTQYLGNELRTQLEGAGNGSSGTIKYCEPKTTATDQGDPLINQFISETANVIWTEEIPNLTALNRILKFRSYLMRDSFSPDFLSDFSEYYTIASFADAGAYFYRLGVDPNGRSYGFNRFYEQGKIKVKRRYVDSFELPAAGIYEVELAIDFKDNWDFFTEDKNPKADITIVLYRIDDPFPNSPFYSMPLNGNIGISGFNRYNRQGYGVNFESSNSELIKLNKSGELVYTYPGPGSNARNNVRIETHQNLFRMNVAPDSRGVILDVERTGDNEVLIIYSPSRATPVLQKITQTNPSDNAFASYYSLSEGQNRVNIGNTLMYWSGAGACLDFSGVPVYEMFQEAPDRKANETTDRIPDIQNIYAIDWSKIEKPGSVYLKSIVYTPFENVYSLRSQFNESVLFTTPNATDTIVEMSGIRNMEHNRVGVSACL